MYFDVVSPGSTNDNISYPMASALKEAFETLPLSLYGLADAAYTLNENMLIPFTGVHRLDPAHDAFSTITCHNLGFVLRWHLVGWLISSVS